MKKNKLLNIQISSLVAGLGHMDSICIGDSGLPVPKNIKKIDIALSPGIPTFFETLKAVNSESLFQEIIVAKEIKELFPTFVVDVLKIIGKVKITFKTHDEFKKETMNCTASIRTGENKPYHNIILVSGVTF